MQKINQSIHNMMRKVLFMILLFEMGRALESSDELEMILFNGAKRVGRTMLDCSGRTMLDCSNSPTAYARISNARKVETSNGFTISMWYRQDEIEYASSTNEISYLFSSGALPGSGTSQPYLAIAIPGKGLASENHLRVYVSNNRNEGEYDFVDTNAPSPSNMWQHIVVVLRPNSWPRPEIFVNAQESNVDISSLEPKTPWWVCGACAKNTGDVIGINCWNSFGGCPSCRSDASGGCAMDLSEISRDWTLCGRTDVNHRRSFDGQISCLRTFERALSVSEIVDLFNSDRDSDECGTSAVRDEDDGFVTTETVFSSSSTNFVVGGDDDDDDGEKEEKDESEENSEATTAMFNKYLNDFHEHFWYIVVIVCLSVILLFRCFCSSSKNGSVSRTYLQRRNFSQTPQSVVEKRPLLKREKKNVPLVVDGFLMKKDDIEMTTVSSVVVPEGSIIGDRVMRERVTSSSVGEKSLLKDL